MKKEEKEVKKVQLMGEKVEVIQLLFMLIFNRKELAEKGRSRNVIVFNVSLTVCFNIFNVITIVDH